MRNSLSLVVAMALIGCSSGENRSRTTTAAQPPHTPVAATMSGCPMPTDAEPTQIVATEMPQGAAISFTTAGDVEALRARIHRMAERHERMRAMQAGGEPDRETSPDDDMYSGMMAHPQMRSAQVTVEDIPGGARLVFVAKSSANITALRTQVRDHATVMARGWCPLMGSRPPAMPNETSAAGL
jgi:hypothetical protein